MARELPLIALALALAVACDKGRQSDPPPATEAAARGEPPLAATDFFRIDAKPVGPCTSGQACEAELVLTALGDYKVNEDYPHKFVGDPEGGCAVDGTGTFRLGGKKRGTMTVRFTPTKPNAKLTGTFKLSVCTEDNCEIEAPEIALPVPSS